MKKLKILLAASLATLPLTQIIVMTSCGDGDKGDETNHVTTEVQKDPEEGKKFEFTFKLDDNYSLNVCDSTIEFGSQSNGVDKVGLSKCTIDSTTKTITVPAEYVTSNQFKLNIISEKQTKIDDPAELKKVVADFLKADTNKNITYEGEINAKEWNGDIEKDPSTWTTNSYKTGKYTYLLKNRDVKRIIKQTTYDKDGNITIPEEQYVNYDIADAKGIGFWHLYVTENGLNNAVNAYPSPHGGLQNTISETFSFDSYIESLNYDSSRNAYDGIIFQNSKNKISFNFYLSKDKKSVKAFEIVQKTCTIIPGPEQKSLINDSRIYCPAKDQGKTTFVAPEESSWTKNNVYTNNEILYDTEKGNYIYHISDATFYSNTRIEIKLDNFVSSKKTLIKINSGDSTTIYKHEDDVLYLGNNKLTKGKDWTIGKDDTDGLYYISINNLDTTQTLYCVSNPTVAVNTNINTTNDGLDVITIYQ